MSIFYSGEIFLENASCYRVIALHTGRSVCVLPNIVLPGNPRARAHARKSQFPVLLLVTQIMAILQNNDDKEGRIGAWVHEALQVLRNRMVSFNSAHLCVRDRYDHDFFICQHFTSAVCTYYSMNLSILNVTISRQTTIKFRERILLTYFNCASEATDLHRPA